MVPSSGIEEQGFSLYFHAIDFVDEEHHGIRSRDGFEERPGQEEFVAEDVVVHFRPRITGLVGLDTQQLLFVVPLVQSLGFIQTLVALETNETRTREFGNALCQLRLAGSRRTLDEHGLTQTLGEVHHSGDAVVGEIVDFLETITHLRNGGECVCHHGKATQECTL
jgi:hypothetical protein